MLSRTSEYLDGECMMSMDDTEESSRHKVNQKENKGKNKTEKRGIKLQNMYVAKLIPPSIVHKDEAPDWLKDNEYLLHGYRVNYNRKRDLFKSLFSIHNETMNIWTHLIGSICFIALAIYIAANFDEAKRLFNSFINEFKKLNIRKLVNGCLKNEINPLIKTLK